jgi:hypothetical protein
MLVVVVPVLVLVPALGRLTLLVAIVVLAADCDDLGAEAPQAVTASSETARPIRRLLRPRAAMAGLPAA